MMPVSDYSNMSVVHFEPREGVSYTVYYSVKRGMIYPEAQGYKGTPVKIGNLGEASAAGFAARSMVAEFKLKSDQEAA